MTIVNRQLIAWANRRGQLESRAAVSSENVSRLVIYSITFLILSLVLALMLFLAVTWILVTGTAPYIGCSLTAGGLVGNVVGSLIGILVEFADGPKHKDDDFRMWIAEHVNNAMTVAQNYTCSSQESQTAFALLTFALGLLRSTGVPLPPELELNVTQYTAMCTKLFTDVLTPVTNTAVEGGSTFIANLDQQGSVYCADLTVFGLPEYCTSAVADWCESNAPPLAKTSITAFGAGLLLLIVLLALLLSLPAMAAQSALGVMDELTVRELALAELHKALHDSQPNEEVPKEPDDGGEPRDDGGEPRAAAAHPSQVELTVPVAEPGRRSDIVIA